MNHSFKWRLGLALMAMGWNLAQACQTAMVPRSRAKVMGKNYIWPMSHGRVMVNRKNMTKKALVKDEKANPPKEWKAKYASLTFNQFAESFPNGGFNSEGVGIEVLLGPAQFPKVAAKGKEAVSELQWIQYILDMSENTSEAIKNAEGVDIVPLADHAVHYHVCDRSGQCAIFEYVDGSLVVSKEDGEDPNPVGCTNSGYANGRSSRPTKGKLNPDINPEELGLELSALPRAVFPAKGDSNIKGLVETFEDRNYSSATDEVSAMFAMMARISSSPQWQIVYELENRRVHFRTQTDGGGRRIKTVALADFEQRDTDCQSAIYYDEGTRVAYVLPLMRHDLSATVQAGERKDSVFPLGKDAAPLATGNVHLKRSDFAMRFENPTLLTQSTSFLTRAGLDSEMLTRVQKYASEKTKCVME